MTSDASNKIDRNKKTSATQEFYVRTIAAWLLLLIPGLLIAFVSRRWIPFLLIGPVAAAPAIILAYDLLQVQKVPGNRIQKLILFSLLGLGLVILLPLLST